MKSIVFGPVISRRFGVSLGIDLSPNQKQCNFDCLYCELDKKKAQESMEDILDLRVLIDSVKEAIEKNPKIDVLTITANGEPTLYPYLYELISEIKLFISKDISTLILSNGSRFGDKRTQEALALFDIVKFSLDGGVDKSFSRVDRPHKNIRLQNLLNGIKEFASIYKGELVAEILLVKNVNDNEENINHIVEFLKQIKITRIDLGTIDRPPAYDVEALDYQELNNIAKKFEGMYISLPHRKEVLPFFNQSYQEDDLLDFIHRRPISLNESKNLFSPQTLQILHQLCEKKLIYIRKIANLEFYTTKK